MSTCVMSDLLWTGVWLVDSRLPVCSITCDYGIVNVLCGSWLIQRSVCKKVLVCYSCNISCLVSQLLWLCALFDPAGFGNLLLHLEWIC